jgi:hypothetical protein
VTDKVFKLISAAEALPGELFSIIKTKRLLSQFFNTPINGFFSLQVVNKQKN